MGFGWNLFLANGVVDKDLRGEERKDECNWGSESEQDIVISHSLQLSVECVVVRQWNEWNSQSTMQVNIINHHPFSGEAVTTTWHGYVFHLPRGSIVGIFFNFLISLFFLCYFFEKIVFLPLILLISTPIFHK